MTNKSKLILFLAAMTGIGSRLFMASNPQTDSLENPIGMAPSSTFMPFGLPPIPAPAPASAPSELNPYVDPEFVRKTRTSFFP